jgi:hypothetical protein
MELGGTASNARMKQIAARRRSAGYPRNRRRGEFNGHRKRYAADIAVEAAESSLQCTRAAAQQDRATPLRESRPMEIEPMTDKDTDKIAAAIMAASICSKVNASQNDYVQNYFAMIDKLAEHERAKRRR